MYFTLIGSSLALMHSKSSFANVLSPLIYQLSFEILLILYVPYQSFRISVGISLLYPHKCVLQACALRTICLQSCLSPLGQKLSRTGTILSSSSMNHHDTEQSHYRVGVPQTPVDKTNNHCLKSEILNPSVHEIPVLLKVQRT